MSTEAVRLQSLLGKIFDVEGYEMVVWAITPVGIGSPEKVSVQLDLRRKKEDE